MRTRFFLALFALIALLYASFALAATPAPPPPSWAWAVAGGCIAVLLAVCGWWIRHWMMQREKKEEAILARIEAMDRRIDERLDRLETGQAIIVERVGSLPCRGDRGNGIPPTAVCSMNDRDTP